jgi:formylglycine-generating enzyme required for sulfatase activity
MSPTVRRFVLLLAAMTVGVVAALPYLAAAPVQPTPLKPGEEREYKIAGGVKMKFCWVPPGKAQLGSPKAERDAVSVHISGINNKAPEWLQFEAEEMRGTYSNKGFWLGKYTVTRAEWAAVMDGTNSRGSVNDRDAVLRAAVEVRRRQEELLAAARRRLLMGKVMVGEEDTSRLPVVVVSWDECQMFLAKLNDRAAGRAMVRAFGRRGKFVLPHEDEWEYACRGGQGNRQPFYWGESLNGKQANCIGVWPVGTAVGVLGWGGPRPVGGYERDYPHPWGLCDMHGNVWQWCENRYNKDAKSGYVVRGGSFCDGAVWCRAAYRTGYGLGNRGGHLGFRACYRPD